ncbi:MAG TPA: PIG-L deacetylase family protein [Candidatus Saccharimonadia bacterium]|nr:PIG-L deacetylase family protein [Candidatus Saccharimonadia bacterium]
MTGYDTALCVSPHPDDDIIGCGGSFATFVASGGNAATVYVTSGENGNREIVPADLGAMREREAGFASWQLGIPEERLTFLRYPDLGTVHHESLIVDSLVTAIQALRPNLIFAPHESDGHPDHITSYKALMTALGRCIIPPPRLLCYEVWTPIPTVDVFVDISTHMPKKIAAMKEHQTQLLKMDYVGKVTEMGQRRSEEVRGAGSCEVFMDVPTDFMRHRVQS